MAMMMFVDKKRNANDLKRIRRAVGDIMRTKEFNNLCEKRLGYTTTPWEIEAGKASKSSVGEPWVSGCQKTERMPTRQYNFVYVF